MRDRLALIAAAIAWAALCIAAIADTAPECTTDDECEQLYGPELVPVDLDRDATETLRHA